MLHRHFSGENDTENITKSTDKEAPPEVSEAQQKRRGRPKKS